MPHHTLGGKPPRHLQQFQAIPKFKQVVVAKIDRIDKGLDKGLDKPWDSK